MIIGIAGLVFKTILLLLLFVYDADPVIVWAVGASIGLSALLLLGIWCRSGPLYFFYILFNVSSVFQLLNT